MISGGSESCHSATTLSTLNNFFDKLQSYKYLAVIHFYRQAISITAHLSFTIQKQQCLITNIVDVINKRKEKIMELQSSECKLPFPSVSKEDGNVKIDAAATNLPANQPFKKENQLSEKQKAKALKCITIHKESITVKKVLQGKQDVKRIQNNLLLLINDCINQRFEAFNDQIFKAMAVVDHHH